MEAHRARGAHLGIAFIGVVDEGEALLKGHGGNLAKLCSTKASGANHQTAHAHERDGHSGRQ
jgi:hypothetical protein